MLDAAAVESIRREARQVVAEIVTFPSCNPPLQATTAVTVRLRNIDSDADDGNRELIATSEARRGWYLLERLRYRVSPFRRVELVFSGFEHLSGPGDRPLHKSR